MQKAILILSLVCLVFCTAQAQHLRQTPNGCGVQLILKQSSYACFDNYTDLTHDTQLFDKVVCVKTTIEKVTVEKGDCPLGITTASYEEVAADTQKFCKLLDGQESARIGFMGSLSGSGSGNDCTLNDFDTSEITKSICVKREINDVKLVQVNGNPCGEGLVLVTPEEALANQAAYCDLLGYYDIIRLANGGSMDGAGYGCKIRYDDRRTLGGILCRSLDNSSATKVNIESIGL